MVNAGLTLQRQKAKYDGGDSAGFTSGTASPARRSVRSGPAPVMDDRPTRSLQRAKSGVYPYSEWQMKQAASQFPWDLSVGAFARHQQGYPYVLFGRFSTPH
jgi:hypothetical protein